MLSPSQVYLLGIASPSANAGLVITNPPYGKRLGEVAELVEVYEALGERLKSSFAGWEASIFTGNPELGAHLGLRAHRFNVLYNGPLECTYYQFHGPRPGQPGAKFAGRITRAASARYPTTSLWSHA